MSTVVDITSIFGRTGLRGLKKCPKCHTFAGNRATFCKRKGCDTSFSKNFERKSTTSASKIYSSAGKLIYSVRLRNNGPDYRGFVEFKQNNNSSKVSSTLDKKNVKCYVLSCKLAEPDGGASERPAATCEHIKSALDCFTEAVSLEIHDNTLDTLQMPKWVKTKIRELLSKYPTQPIVQRVSKHVMVVKDDKLKKPIVKKKQCKQKALNDGVLCNFVHTFFHNGKGSDEKRYSCSCTKRRKPKNCKRDKLISGNKETSADTIQKHCWHYYACVAAFASNTELSNEFSKYMTLSNLAYKDTSQDSPVNNYFSLCPSNNGIFVELSDNLLLQDNLLKATENQVIKLAGCNSVIELQPELNLQQHNSIDWSFACSDKETQDMVSNFNFVVSNSNLSMADENVTNENATHTCYQVTEIDLNDNTTVLPISDGSILSGLDNSPIKVFDIQVDKMGDNTDLYNENDDIKIITMDECDDELSNEADDVISDGHISIEPSDVVVSKDIFDEVYKDKSIFVNRDTTSLRKKSPVRNQQKNLSKSADSKNCNKMNINTSSENVVLSENVWLGNSRINNGVASSETSLEFIHWLSSVTEMMNNSMHYKALEKHEPLSFQVNQKLFDCFCDRLSYGSSKKRMPNETTTFNLNRPPFGTFTKFTWIVSNVFHLKKIFETPLVPLKLTRRFIQNNDGTFYDIKDDKTTTQPDKLNTSAKKPKHLTKKTDILVYLKVGHTEENQEKATPFFVEWIPDILPITKTGELRLVFEFGFRKRNIYFS